MPDTDHTDPMRIVIVEDEDLYRDLLKTALAQEPRLEVVAFADGESALEACCRLQPSVAIVDIALGDGMNGVQFGLLLRRELPKVGIVLLSNHLDYEYLRSIPEEVISG